MEIETIVIIAIWIYAFLLVLSLNSCCGLWVDIVQAPVFFIGYLFYYLFHLFKKIGGSK